MGEKQNDPREYLSEIIDSDCIITIVVDEKCNLIFVNKGAEKVSGYKKNELIGKNCINLFMPKGHRSRIAANIRSSFRGSKHYVVTPIVTKTGKKRILFWNGKVVKRKDGSKVVAAYGHDITKEIQIKREFESKEKIYKQLVENSFAIIYTKDLKGRYRSANPAWNVFRGVDFKSTIGKTDHQIFERKTASHFRYRDNQVVRTKKMQTFFDTFTVKGKTHYQTTVKYPLTDDKGKITGICGISHDVTDRVLAQKELKIFERIFEQSSEGMAIASLNGTIIELNNSWAKMHGYRSQKNLVGKHLRIFHTKEQLEKEVKIFNRKALQNDHHSGIVGHVKKNRQKFLTFMTTSLLRNEKGEPYAIVGVARDITKEKEMEDKIRDNEQKFRTIFEESPIGLAIVSKDFYFTKVNPTLCKMLGYAEKELLKIRFPDITHKTTARRDVENAQKLFKGELPLYKTEKQYIKKNGKLIWASLTVSALHNGRGKPQHMLGMVEDISERKKAQQALKASEEKYRTLIETAPNGVLIVDKHENLLFSNEQLAKMLGYRVEEIVGKNLKDFTHQESFEKFQRGTMHRLKGISSQYESSFMKKDGTEMSILLSAAPLKDEKGGHLSSMSVVTDISAIKEAEKALKKSEEKYRTLFNNLTVGLYRATFGKHGKFIDANPALAHILGYKNREELMKIKISDIYQDPSERISYSNKIAQKKYLKNEYTKMKKKDGTPIIVADTAHAITDNKGKLLYFDGILEDVTEKRKLEQQIKQYAEHLENMVLKRTRELEEQTKKAVEASRIKSEFLASVSHELRTPITSIIGYTELLEDNAAKTLDETEKKHLEVIKKNTKHLLQLISDILDLTRIEKNKMHVEIETFSLRELVREMVKTFKPLFAKKGLKLEMEINKNVPEQIASDKQKIKQILFNLIGNALKFTPEGEVKLSVFIKNKEIFLEVKDSGIGISPEDQKKLFDMFQRSSHPLVRKIEGSGLGLVLTKKMVNLLDGDIKVESDISKGSSFRVNIPLK